MDENDYRYYKNKVFGDNAESIFEYLINSLDDWEFINYGVEHHIESLKRKIRKNYHDVAEKIRHMPDYAIVNEKGGKVMFFEIKRTSFIDRKISGKLIFGFQKNLIEKYKEFWNEGNLFIVHQQEPYFHIIKLEDINEECKIGGDFYTSEENLQDYKRPYSRWDFKNIRKGIREVFPNIKSEILEEARKMIMEKEPEKK